MRSTRSNGLTMPIVIEAFVYTFGAGRTRSLGKLDAFDTHHIESRYGSERSQYLCSVQRSGWLRVKSADNLGVPSTLQKEMVDSLCRISILRRGPSAPNGGRSSVRMGELNVTIANAGAPSG
jgi:hypothetical protein